MFNLIIFLTILFDYLLTFLIPSYNNLNLLYPMLTIVLIVFLHKKISNKKYLKLIFIIGFIYDILFSYIFLFNSLIFLSFAKIIKKIDKYIRFNLFINIILVCLFIVLYDLILFFVVYISNYTVVNISNLLYKIKNSFLLNIIYYFLLEFIYKFVKIQGNHKLKK